MPLSKSHKEATRRKIIESAGRLFREKGYEGVGIAGIMSDVGLTRGGFYAHFWSKASLFREVLRSRAGLVARLQTRGTDVSTMSVLHKYLNPKNLKQSRTECTLAGLSGDVARTDAITQQAYTKVFRNLMAELKLDPGMGNDQRVILTAVLAVGGVMLAGALSDKQLAAHLLEACQNEIENKLS